MSRAILVREVEGFKGDARLYRLEPPMSARRFDGNKYVERPVPLVIVSATNVPFGGGPETYVFEANEDGEVTNWGELDGSFKGGLDHAEALRGAGYEVES